MTGEPRLRITGIRGFLEGEQRLLEVGDELTIGRSRDADLSVRKAPRFLARRDREELLRSERMRSISRRHVLIRYHTPDRVEIQDLSSNGTFIDRDRILDSIDLTDLEETSHVIAVGSAERLSLDLVAAPAD